MYAPFNRHHPFTVPPLLSGIITPATLWYWRSHSWDDSSDDWMQVMETSVLAAE